MTVYAIIAVSTDVRDEVAQLEADDRDEAMVEADDAQEAEDVKLTPEERAEARQAARIAAREARKADREARRLRLRQDRQEQKLLSRWAQMSTLWGEAEWGGVTRRAYVLLLDEADVLRTIKRLRDKWPDVTGEPRIQVGAVLNLDGSTYVPLDDEGNPLNRDFSPANWLWRFMGDVQDGVTEGGEPIMRARRRSDPWKLPVVLYTAEGMPAEVTASE